MTLGMWIDYIIEWNALNTPPESDKGGDQKDGKDTKRYANQSDFDKF